MDRVILWDFDETLAQRPGRWNACLRETLDEHVPGHGIEREQLRPFLKGGFPWHTPERAHPELCEPEAWWERVEALLVAAYEGVGLEEARARSLARLARERYVDPSVGWRLFPDTVPVLEELRADGWTHAILSNHVPELPALVEALGLGELVEVVLTSALTGYEKPHRAAFELALERCGSPQEVWMVGDNPVADVEGAEAVGIPAVLVRTEGSVARHAADLYGVPAFLS